MIGKLVRTLLGAAIEGFQRFPATVIGVSAIAIISNLEIANVINLSSTIEEQVYSALVAFSMASLMKKIGVESYGYNVKLQHVSALIAGGIFAALAWFAKDVGLTHLAFFAGLTGAILAAAHWFRGTSEVFWFYVARLIFAVALAFVAVIVFGLGVSAILASLDYLFGVDVPSRLYQHIWATSLIAAGPIFALGRIPEDFDAMPVIDGNNHSIAGLRLLSDYLAAPLLAIFALILHAYALKILITGEVPQGQIGWMVIGFGTLIIFFWKVMLPLREVLTVSGRLFLKYWPFLVVLPMILLGYALYLRIGEYGVTPERYFLAAFGVLMTVFALMQAVSFTRNWLPGTAPLTVIMLILGSFGPWGAEQVSLNSQVKQFAQLLDDKSQILAGKGERASNLLRFIAKRDALSSLQKVIGPLQPDPFEHIDSEDKYRFRTRLEKAIGVDTARKIDDYKKNRIDLNFEKGIVSVAGFDLSAGNISLTPPSSMLNQITIKPNTKMYVEKTAIIVEHKGTRVSFSYEPMKKFAESEPQTTKATAFVLVSGNKKILLVPKYVHLDIKDGLTVQSGNGDIFLRSGDWE